MAGNELPGTRCEGGTCDGRGNCQMALQQSCTNPSETGCGVVFLTGGSFVLGNGSAFRAMPVQEHISVGAYTLDAYEVTIARFQRFWDAGHPAPTGAVVYPSGGVPWAGVVRAPRTAMEDNACNFGAAGRVYHPVNCVDHATAQAFCVWDGGRLPTEAEWEFAARQHLAAGVDAGRIYPWGPQPPAARCDRAQWNRCPGDDGGVTRRVGSFAQAAGFFDLAGNVWEWTIDRFALYADARCWGNVARSDPRCDANPSGYPTIRGGSWFSADPVLLMGASRDDAYAPTTQSPLVGFRCAHTRTR